MDKYGVAHVFVAPVYKDYHFVNFMQRARGAEDGKYVSSMATYFNVEYDEAICRLPVCTGSLKIRI